MSVSAKFDWSMVREGGGGGGGNEAVVAAPTTYFTGYDVVTCTVRGHILVNYTNDNKVNLPI